MKKLGFTTFLMSTVFISSTLASSNYCAGIRGNGELAPAHWGAMARIVENKGMPKTLAGGSSAAITLFLLDAVSRNELVSKDSLQTKHNQQALMLKTFVPHIMHLINEDVQAPRIMRMLGNITGIGDDGFIGALKKAVQIARDLPTFFKVLGEYGPLLNPEMAKGLRQNFSFYKKQIGEAIKVFGSFNAKEDMNIFYRKGLVDFKYLGVLFGRVADFYAGYGHERANKKFQSFLNECSEVSNGRNWSEIIKVKPSCGDSLKDALSSYYGPIPGKKKVRRLGGKVSYTKNVFYKRQFPNKMIFEEVGSGLNTFPTTSLVIGDAVRRYKEKLSLYEKNQAKDVEDFNLDFETELRYGYWGTSKGLAKIKTGLKKHFADDLKSGHFKALDGGSWFEVLATSPAEPGLSNLQRIPNGPSLNKKAVINKNYFYRKNFFLFTLPTLTAIEWFNEKNPSRGFIPFREEMYSAGGWSDLHPTLVLKAHGCDDIVYVTRQGGESVFGQQIFIRLTGDTDKISFWKEIKEGNRRGWTNLSSEEEASPWNQLYNLMNSTSSYNKSIQAATAVYCTNWDKFNVLGGEIEPTLKDAYHAPVFANNPEDRDLYNFGLNSDGMSEDGFPGCILKDFNVESNI